MEFVTQEIAGIVILVNVFLFVVFKAVWLLVTYLKEFQNQNELK